MLETLIDLGVDGVAVMAVIILWRSLRADAEHRRQEEHEYRDRLMELHTTTIKAMQEHTGAVRELTQLIEGRGGK